VYSVYNKTMNNIDPRLLALQEKHRWKGCFEVPTKDVEQDWRELEPIIDDHCEGRWDIHPGCYKFELATDAAWFRLAYG